MTCSSGAVAADEGVVWSLGKTDGSAIEFAPGARKELVFTIGTSVPSRDFAGHQDGTIGADPAASGEKPYSIEFTLEAPPEPYNELELNLIYHYGAPKYIRIDVNNKKGIYPVQPVPKKDVDTVDGNLMLLAKQQLIVPIPGEWLKAAGNRITIFPVGLGGWEYDSVTLRKPKVAEEASGGVPQLEPTVFFVKDGERLMEQCRLFVPFHGNFQKGSARIDFGGTAIHAVLDADDLDFGVLAVPVSVPASKAPTNVAIEVTLDGKSTSASHRFTPAKQWKVFICPKIHNDVGYTDLQPHVNELDTRNTDTVLSILSRFPFYKFNFETSWLVENYFDCRPAAYRNEFLQHAKEGRATTNAFYLNLMTGICTGEELYRALYYTHRLHREHGTNFDFACLTDVPSHSWFLPTLLKEVGIPAFANGSNQGRAPILVFSDLNEVSPFYWEGMNGERIMMWYARVYAQLKMLTAQGFISPHEGYEYFKVSIPQFLTRYLRDDYAPDAVMIYGAYIDNAAIPETGEAELIEQWNKEFAFPQLIVASDAEYFQYVDKHFAAQLPTYRGDAGAYWEDGIASSAEATAWNRQTQQILPVAETSSSFATMFEPRFRYPVEDFRAAWKDLLFYDEHTWGAFNSTSQPEREGVRRQWEVKESYARRANLDARNLLARSLSRLCQQMAVADNTIFAFNWQNRVRSEPLVTDLSKGSYLVDLATDKPVPVDVLVEKDGYQVVRFLAENVPALGYRGYGIRMLNPPADATKKDKKASSESDWTIESAHYRLTVDEQTGGIKSLFDKADQRDLVDQQAEHGLNQYLYVSGGEESLILNQTFGTPPAKLKIDTPSSAKLIEKVRGPFGQRIVVEMSTLNTPLIRSEYRLYDQIKRVDIIDTFEKREVRDKEAVYFAFPLAADKPALEYQIQNGWVRPNDDQLPGACREWFTPQNLVHLRDGGFSVAWSSREAPLVTFVDINRGLWPTHLDVTNGHLYSYVMNNYWFTNYRASQGGRMTCHYSITSGSKMSREQLGDFDTDTRSPVFLYPYLSTFSAGVNQQDRRLNPSSGTLLELDAPNLQVVVLKAAEDGDGYILRLLETAGRSGSAELKSPLLPVEQAFLCNGVEVNQQELKSTAGTVTIPYQPQQYTTVRLRVGEALRNSGGPSAQ
ncbi:MAG: glycoside hydrolase family 38 C-terminal domain-containing protein [Pirellulales bacterium]